MSWKSLTGEPLALDLVNTIAGSAHGDVDLLDSPAALREWLEIQQDRLTTPRPDQAGDVDVQAVHELRTTVAGLLADVRAGAQPAGSALRALVDAQRAAPGYAELVWDGASPTAVPRRDGSPTAVLLADLAAAAVDLLADPRVTTIRDCGGPNCRMMFLPTNPRRQWCRPTVCGNRARVARYYEAHKG